ncbi:hypothetical protein BH23GEM6_BH23GEM6_02870 [soil metagenome]
MYISKIKKTALVAFAIAALPGMAAAQQSGAPSAAEQQQVQGWLAEMQQIHGELQELQTRALQDPQLSAAQLALGESIRTAMEQADPTLQQRMQRLQTLDSEAAAAQQAGDNAKLQQLGAEVQQIQEQFVAAQQKALVEQPQLAAQMQTFQTDLEAKMVQLNPQAEQLLARFEQLQTRLAGVMQGAQR